MKLKQKKVATLVATLITLGSFAGVANAALLFNFSDNGADLDVTVSGSLSVAELAGWNFGGTSDAGVTGLTINDDVFGSPNGDTLWLMPTEYNFYEAITSSDLFTGTALAGTAPSSISGDNVGIDFFDGCSTQRPSKSALIILLSITPVTICGSRP